MKVQSFKPMFGVARESASRKCSISVNCLPKDQQSILDFVVLAVHVLYNTSGPALIVVLPCAQITITTWPNSPEFGTYALKIGAKKILLFLQYRACVLPHKQDPTALVGQ